MNAKLTKTAAVLSFIIGAMAIFAGGQVLLGKTMNYYVIDGLPIYNFIVGIISAFFTRRSGKAAKWPPDYHQPQHRDGDFADRLSRCGCSGQPHSHDC